MILINELLYKDNSRTLFKTYCPVKRHFGISLQNDSGVKELLPEFSHVFHFMERRKVAVVTATGDYKWVDLDLTISNMSHAEENLVSCLHMRYSLCNCYQPFKATNCSMCSKGVIRNPSHFRRIENEQNMVFEYETEKGTYRITLKEVPSMNDSYDYLWNINDLGFNVQDLIDSYEETETDYSKLQWICIHSIGSDEAHGQSILKDYTMRIEMIDVSMLLIMNDDKLYLDLF